MSEVRRITNNIVKTGGTGTGTWKVTPSLKMETDLGLDYITLQFADHPNNFLNITFEFLFANPCTSFVADGSLLLWGSYSTENYTQKDGANGVGTAAEEIVSLSQSAYLKLVEEFLADGYVEIVTPY